MTEDIKIPLNLQQDAPRTRKFNAIDPAGETQGYVIGSCDAETWDLKSLHNALGCDKLILVEDFDYRYELDGML